LAQNRYLGTYVIIIGKWRETRPHFDLKAMLRLKELILMIFFSPIEIVKEIRTFLLRDKFSQGLGMIP